MVRRRRKFDVAVFTIGCGVTLTFARNPRGATKFRISMPADARLGSNSVPPTTPLLPARH